MIFAYDALGNSIDLDSSTNMKGLAFGSAGGPDILQVNLSAPDSFQYLAFVALKNTSGGESSYDIQYVDFNPANYINYAQVTDVDQFDPDSTPNNNPGPTPHEDDESSVTIVPDEGGGSTFANIASRASAKRLMSFCSMI